MSKHRRNTNNEVDIGRATRAVAELLEALGYDSSAPLLKDTPQRVVQSFQELTQARDFEISFFPNESSYDEPLLINNIAFVSLCEHHLLPFTGVAHIGYVPGKQLIGISALPYIVEKFAHSLQLQEPLTDEIAEYLEEHSSAKGVAVMIEADHMCMQVRGVRAVGARTVTHAFRGELKDDPLFRTWFYNAVSGGLKPETDQIKHDKPDADYSAKGVDGPSAKASEA